MNLTFDQFVEKYQPIINNENANFEGYAFEYVELKKVKDLTNNHIWTLVHCDFEEQYIIPGQHFINRGGYFVTEIPWLDEDHAIEIDLNERINIDEAIQHCFIFFVENHIDISKEDITKWYREHEAYTHDTFSTSKAKILAMELYEDELNTEISENLEDLIHDYYSQI